LISQGVPPIGGVKQGWGGENNLFSTKMRQYLENGRRYIQSYYYCLTRSCTCAFDWHQDRWPWTTWVRISRDFADLGGNNS